jgi:hypothetical protein
MKMFFAVLLLALPVSAAADHLDVIEVTLNEGCSLDKYMAITNDFNTQWASQNGYKAEILTPIQSQNQVSIYWTGRSANAAAFGKAWDTWRDAQADPNSIPSKLSARFGACSKNVGRRGYDVH